MTTAVKWAGKSRDLVEGFLAPYGGPIHGKDLQGESFEPDTDFALDWFGDWQRPGLYQHGLDETIKTSVVGRLKLTPKDKGVWAQMQLDKAHEYYEEIAQLVDEGALGFSSGSMAHLVEVEAKTGKIKRWPIIEGSLTPTPANPDAKAGYAVKSADAIEHLAVLGVEAPDAIKGDLDVTVSGEPTNTDLTAEDREWIGFPADGRAEVKAGRVLSKANEEDMATAMAALESAMERLHAVMGRAMPEGMGEHDDENHKSLNEPIKSATTPQALHDAAVASGAACSPGETEAHEPAPLLAIAGKSAEPEPTVDLDAIKAQLRAVAVSTARELLGR